MYNDFSNLDSLGKPNVINRSRIKELASRCRNEIGRSKSAKNTKNGTRAKGKFELTFTINLTSKPHSNSFIFINFDKASSFHKWLEIGQIALKYEFRDPISRRNLSREFSNVPMFCIQSYIQFVLNSTVLQKYIKFSLFRWMTITNSKQNLTMFLRGINHSKQP